MATLKNKTLFITGASRGIGREIALKAASDGANIVITAKTATPHPKLKGTIHSVADEVIAAGGQAMPIQLDVRDENAISKAVEDAVKHFGRLDILVNNASAISLTPTLETPMKRFDLMHSVNVRATFACAQACLPHLLKADNPHILTLSPPLNMHPRWFKDHLAYTMSKYGMSMCTLGLAEEWRDKGIRVNSLWPKTTIATDAIAVHFPEAIFKASRKPNIVADAAYYILTDENIENTGNVYIDEDILREHGITNFDNYAITPGIQPFPDLYLE